MIQFMTTPADDPDEMRRALRRLRTAFHQQFEFMAILAPDGRVLDYNRPLAAEAPDQPRAQVLGQLFWQTHWFRDLPALQSAWPSRLRQAATASGPVQYDDGFTSSSGELRHATAAVTAVNDEHGRLDCFVVQATDTTERRRADSMRRTLEEQLRESQKLEAIGTLAGGIAHDFNNLLGAMLGNVALARDACGSGHPALEPLGQVRRAGQRARTLVHQILAFSRQQPHAMVVQPLRPVVEETVALLRSTLPATVRLDTHLAESGLWVCADGTQVQQVLMNLCTNAWHALPDSCGRIVVGLDEAADNGVALWVADDGCGIDAATRARIFEPFFTTKPVHLGTGLGLSVAHGIAVEHGGRIDVDSAPGCGSRFTLWLPRDAAGSDADFDRVDSAAMPLDGGGHHVLYVDDDEFMALVVERLLRRAGYSVAVYRDALQALAALRDHPERFDLVITDHNMPGCTGLDLAREAARLRPALPVIISSGYISDSLRSQAQQAGVRHLMHKESTLEELFTLARRFTDGPG